MFGFMALFGDIGCSLGPWLAGVVSDNVQNTEKLINYAVNSGISAEQFGLKAGIFTGIIFPVIMVIGLLKLKQKNSFKSETPLDIT